MATERKQTAPANPVSRRCIACASSIDANVGIAVSAPATAEGTLAAPNSSEAIELLLELCRLCGLGAEADQNDQDWTALPPYKAGFFAALMLPFYRFTGLRPQFPPPHLSTKDAAGFDENIDQAATHRLAQGLRYFMTLSLHPPSLGSILWSIFWQPDIECNLVSPWLAAIIDTLDPTIHAKRVDILVKTFASRRPKVAFWWLALCLLGDVSVLDWIRRYAQTQSEQYGYGSLSPPDPMVSAWVGSKQSFLDFDKTSCYTGPSDLVTRADLLRCRFNCKLQDSASTTLSWRPFGHMSKQCIEPDLWPSLEAECVREYSSFTWYLGKQRRATSLGYQRESGRAIEEVRDMVEVRLPGDMCQGPCRHDIKLAPSKEATLNMLSLLVEDASGTRHWANAAVLLQNLHPWMRGWEGLDTMEIPDRRAPDDTPKRTTVFASAFFVHLPHRRSSMAAGTTPPDIASQISRLACCNMDLSDAHHAVMRRFSSHVIEGGTLNSDLELCHTRRFSEMCEDAATSLVHQDSSTSSGKSGYARRWQDCAELLWASVDMDARCDGVESCGVKVDGVKQRSGWWVEGQGTRILVSTPVLTLALPLVLGHVHQCFTPHVLRDSHHTSCKPAGFTPLVLRASHHTSCKPILFHTTLPASVHASHHSSCELHTTHPASLQASHHTSFFTPHVLDPEIAPVLVFAAQLPKLSASFIPLSSNHRVTTVLMACMRPERELPYPAQTLYIRVDEQLTGGRHKPDFGFTTSATTARNVKARWDVRSSSAFYGGKTTSECIIACEPFGHFK
ncbi:hypothetical protein Purlil1_14051 [Purpureocillium lilacinum]|uniref:Uncharacterized protein n=1 Tax=Purpureocillium lilacinum TaxID=33203 RepID=A0ABR0BCD6_PURLI|nr:hypothetical protein Purlil1_14051 [Purpureocillium lilacinum]